MLGYSRTGGLFQPEALVAFDRAEIWVRRMPDRDSRGRPLRCHEVARAVHKLFERHGVVNDDWEIVDGKYGPVEHSWLALRAHGRMTILDVYAVGRLPPVQLVSGAIGLAALYSAGVAPRGDISETTVAELVERCA